MQFFSARLSQVPVERSFNANTILYKSEFHLALLFTAL